MTGTKSRGSRFMSRCSVSSLVSKLSMLPMIKWKDERRSTSPEVEVTRAPLLVLPAADEEDDDDSDEAARPVPGSRMKTLATRLLTISTRSTWSCASKSMNLV